MPEAQRPARRWIWGLWAGVVAIVATVPWHMGSAEDLHVLAAEGGPLENAQIGVWALAMVCALVLAPRLEGSARWSTGLFGVLALLALARELDLHQRLNPEVLGRLGVRYRLDWWLDAGVDWRVKLGWCMAGALVMGAMSWLAWKGRAPWQWRRARPRFLVLAAVFLGMGFVCDDLLRERVAIVTAQLIEEAAELIGAVCFLCAVLASESRAGD